MVDLDRGKEEVPFILLPVSSAWLGDMFVITVGTSWDSSDNSHHPIY